MIVFSNVLLCCTDFVIVKSSCFICNFYLISVLIFTELLFHSAIFNADLDKETLSI